MTNLGLLQVRLSKNIDKKRPEQKNPFSLASNIDRSKGQQNEFENSRFVPTVKFIIQDQLSGGLDSSWFPWVGESPPAESGATSASSFAAPARTRAKPSWATKKRAGSNSVNGNPTIPNAPVDPRSNGARILLFCIGGVTCKEVVAVHESAQASGREIIIGSTHIWNPDQFLEATKHLHRRGSRAANFWNFSRPPTIARAERSDGSHRTSDRSDGSRRNSERSRSGRERRPESPKTDPAAIGETRRPHRASPTGSRRPAPERQGSREEPSRRRSERTTDRVTQDIGRMKVSDTSKEATTAPEAKAKKSWFGQFGL